MNTTHELKIKLSSHKQESCMSNYIACNGIKTIDSEIIYPNCFYILACNEVVAGMLIN